MRTFSDFTKPVMAHCMAPNLTLYAVTTVPSEVRAPEICLSRNRYLVAKRNHTTQQVAILRDSAVTTYAHPVAAVASGGAARVFAYVPVAVSKRFFVTLRLTDA